MLCWFCLGLLCRIFFLLSSWFLACLPFSFLFMLRFVLSCIEIKMPHPRQSETEAKLRPENSLFLIEIWKISLNNVFSYYAWEYFDYTCYGKPIFCLCRIRGQMRAVFPPKGVYPEEQMARGGSRVACPYTLLHSVQGRCEEVCSDVKHGQVCLPTLGFFILSFCCL